MEGDFFDLVSTDFEAWANIGSNQKSLTFALKLLLFDRGFRFVLETRLSSAINKFYLVGPLLRKLYLYSIGRRYSCEIGHGTQIGGGLYVPHPVAIVIHGKTIIGKNVTILQSVTLGAVKGDGAGLPILGDGVVVSAGACVLGGVKVGTGATIGANAVVLKDVSPGAVAVGVPARELNR